MLLAAAPAGDRQCSDRSARGSPSQPIGRNGAIAPKFPAGGEKSRPPEPASAGSAQGVTDRVRIIVRRQGFVRASGDRARPTGRHLGIEPDQDMQMVIPHRAPADGD